MNSNLCQSYYGNSGFSEVGDLIDTSCSNSLFIADELFPLNLSIYSAHGIGRFYLWGGGVAIRGGGWADGADAGAFSLIVSSSNSVSNNTNGFRCVYRP